MPRQCWPCAVSNQPLLLAQEELEAELGLERLHLVADRALRDVQLARRTREAQVPRRRLEGAQRGQRGQPPRHARP